MPPKNKIEVLGLDREVMRLYSVEMMNPVQISRSLIAQGNQISANQVRRFIKSIPAKVHNALLDQEENKELLNQAQGLRDEAKNVFDALLPLAIGELEDPTPNLDKVNTFLNHVHRWWQSLAKMEGLIGPNIAVGVQINMPEVYSDMAQEVIPLLCKGCQDRVLEAFSKRSRKE